MSEKDDSILDELKTNAARLSTIIKNLQEGVLVENENRDILLVNEEFLRLFGIPAQPTDIIGANCANAAEESKGLFADPAGFVSRINQLLENQKLAKDDVLEMIDGRILERDYVPIFLEDTYLGHMWAYRNITEKIHARKKIEEQAKILEEANIELKKMAAKDPLTGLNNRREFTARILEELDRVQRYNSSLSLILLDIDHFKMFNDTYGHLQGDAILKTVSGILQNNTRKVDFVSRYGGEEFSILLPETTEKGALEACEKLRQAIEAYDWQPQKVTASFGCTTLEDQHENHNNEDLARLLISQADEALYHSKAHGRNRSSHHDVIHRESENS